MTGTKYGCGIAACAPAPCTRRVATLVCGAHFSLGSRPIVTIEAMVEDPWPRRPGEWVSLDVVNGVLPERTDHERGCLAEEHSQADRHGHEESMAESCR